MRRAIKALTLETGQRYRGIIYGGFMATADGVKLIKFNVRFGDPEGINALALLETDFLEICQAIVNGTLHELDIKFKPLATVVKYIVPFNYGLPKKQTKISLVFCCLTTPSNGENKFKRRKVS